MSIFYTAVQRTLKRNVEWTKTVNIYTSASKILPNNGKIWHNLGKYEYDAGTGSDNLIKAEKLYLLSTKLNVEQKYKVCFFKICGSHILAQY